MRVILISITLSVFSSFSLNQDYSQLITTESYSGLIMSDSSYCFCSSKKVKRFTPSKTEIIELETMLTQQIEELNKDHISQYSKKDFIESNLNKYGRQYLGFIDKKNG